MLSRPQKVELPLLEIGTPEVITYHTSSKIETHIHIDPLEVSRILKGYEGDPAVQQILKKLEKETSTTYSRSSDGLIYFHDHSGRRRLYIPKPDTARLISEVHDSIIGVAHAGFERTYAKIANYYYWPRMTRDI